MVSTTSVISSHFVVMKSQDERTTKAQSGYSNHQNMKTINFYIQAFFLVLTVIILVSAIFYHEMIFWMIYLQFFLGSYQFLAGTLLSIQKSTRPQFLMYWGLSVINLLLIAAGVSQDRGNQDWLVVIPMFVLPWGLACYYFWLSYRWFHQS